MSSQKESWQDFVLSSPQPCSTTKFRLAASVEVMLMMRGSPRIVLRAVVGGSRFYGMRPVCRIWLGLPIIIGRADRLAAKRRLFWRAQASLHVAMAR